MRDILINNREFLMVITIIAIMFVVAFMLTKLWTITLNIMAYNKSRRQPDLRNQKQGIVFNKKTGKLEADQSFITPL